MQAMRQAARARGESVRHHGLLRVRLRQPRAVVQHRRGAGRVVRPHHAAAAAVGAWPRQATPIPFLDEDEPRPGRLAEPLPPPFRPKPKREYRRVNPKYCLNHDELPTEHTCSQCRLPFCSKCVLTLQGEVLCGPCKNFKVRGMQRPTRLTPLAILAAVLGVAAGMMSFCLSFVGGASQAQSAGGGLVAAVFGLVALLPPGGALVMSFYALHEIETKPRVGGRALAMTGTVASLVGLVWTVNVILIIIIKGVQSL